MMMHEISLEKALRIARWKEDEIVYMLVRVWPETTVRELSLADKFLIDDGKQEPEPAPNPAPAPKPEKKREIVSKVDHARIVALYTANPPRSVSWIADDIGCSVQTVINHLTHEGIYKTLKERANDGKDTNDD